VRHTVKSIINIIEDFAPLRTDYGCDNSGLLFGGKDWEVKGVLITLDLMPETVSEAIKNNCNLIVVHHPPIFTPINAFNISLPTHNAFCNAIKHDIAIYSAHLNVDFAEKGLNYRLMKTLGGENIAPVDGDSFNGLKATLKAPMSLKNFALHCKAVLKDETLTYLGDDNKIIKSFTAINGGGASESAVLASKNAGADVFLSADFKYHLLLLAKGINCAIINFGHYHSEIAFIDLIHEVLVKNGLGEMAVKSKNHSPIAKFLG